MLLSTRNRLDAIVLSSPPRPATASSGGAGQCGKGWTGNKGDCRRAQLKKIGKEAKHVAGHLGENVAAWGVGKVVGGAIAQVGVKHGLDPEFSKQISETAVQALTATLLHARKKENRNAKELSTYFLAQTAAAYLGKSAHKNIDESLLGADAHVRQIAAMAAGKGTGIGIASGAKRSLSNLVNRFNIRRDSNSRSPLTADEHEALFTLSLLGILTAQKNDRADGRKVLQKISGKRPGKPCGKSFIAVERKCKSHYTNGKLNTTGKAAAEKLAEKIRSRKGIQPKSASSKKTRVDLNTVDYELKGEAVFGKPATYSGKKTIETTRKGTHPDDEFSRSASLTIEQEYKGAKTYRVYSRSINGETGGRSYTNLGVGLNLKEAKSKAKNILESATHVGVGGEIRIKKNDRTSTRSDGEVKAYYFEDTSTGRKRNTAVFAESAEQGELPDTIPPKRYGAGFPIHQQLPLRS